MAIYQLAYIVYFFSLCVCVCVTCALCTRSSHGQDDVMAPEQIELQHTTALQNPDAVSD